MFNFFGNKRNIHEKVFQVRLNQTGILFKNNKIHEKLPTGTYKYNDPENEYVMLAVSTISRIVNVTNQEILSKDNIAFRFSYFYAYKIENMDKMLENFEIASSINNQNDYYLFQQIETRVSMITHAHIRKLISEINSEEINEKRNEITDFKTENMVNECVKFGILLEQASLRDLTFPKNIQDLFAKHLEAKIRTKTDLENARTAVATARALKNASELMQGDENIKFFQYLETINKIAAKGRHTFIIGENPQNGKKI